MSEPATVRDDLVPQLIDEWAAIDALLSSLRPEDWRRPTPLPGWDVQDTVAHIIGTEAMLAGDEMPTVATDVMALSHVRNDIAAANEVWVESLRGTDPAAVLDRFRSVTSRRAAALSAMTQDDFDAPSWTPVGKSTYGRFMQIRLFDCWLHEQDIRDAVDRPGHENGAAAEASVDEIERALGFVVGKRAAAPDGAAVTIELTGPVTRHIHVVVDGRAQVVHELDRPATTVLRLGSGLFVRLAGGRVDPAAHLAEIAMEGDVDLARRLVDNLAFTI